MHPDLIHISADRLLPQKMTPPAKPIGADATALSGFPEDLKRLLNLYGAGSVNDYLFVYSPSVNVAELNLRKHNATFMEITASLIESEPAAEKIHSLLAKSELQCGREQLMEKR